MAQNLIYSINGPVVTIKGKTDLSMMEMVYVGDNRLVGEVIRMNSETATIQVYEETSGLAPGQEEMCIRDSAAGGQPRGNPPRLAGSAAAAEPV